MGSKDQDKPSESTGSDSLSEVTKQLESSKHALEHATESARKTIRDGSCSLINHANTALASIEGWTDQVKEKVVPAIAEGLHQGSIISEKALSAYDRRHEFGPHIVAGTGLFFGGIVALRRGRLPGAFAGFVGSSLAYGIIYEPIPFENILDSALGSSRR